MEPVSPELVLVDPGLALRSRVRLADPVDTLARVDDLVAASRRASLARRSVEIPLRPASARLEPKERVSRVGRRRTAALAGGVAAGTLVAALLIGVRVDLGGNPAGADTAPVVVPPVVVEPAAPTVPSTPPPNAPTQPRANRPPRETKPSPQRFAWAPVAGASAYHVELFRGSSKVFEADTTRPALTIPARWAFEQKRQTLQSGNYRWYVWPVTSDTRAARAVVQATLTVPSP